jgi:hypothetical protein
MVIGSCVFAILKRGAYHKTQRIIHYLNYPLVRENCYLLEY